VGALAHEVEALGFQLIVQILELDNPLEKKLVSELQLLVGDLTLVHDSDGDNELAVM
jgi:hypothetical protein